ncbi:hypothetical protein F5Y05DRAFT_410425 [Hypoxylon sp. FL0543]|nr:hypothetical protein F5Y05DRAFT_410425 [Hypoxylon sp. FL0543]
MADARALLRAHKAENRIKHPLAAYSDAGKLLCKACHEQVRSEALWDAHIQSDNHRQRSHVLKSQSGSGVDRRFTGDDDDGEDGTGDKKRKHASLSSTDEDDSDSVERLSKKNKPNRGASNGGEKRQSPPTLDRRASNTPVQGVEIAIPSRPATPAAGSNSATSTPLGVPVGRSPLIGSETASTSTSTPAAQANQPISTQALAVPSTTTTTTTTTTQPPASDRPPTAIDETEWAAFEAEVANAPTPPPPTSALAALSSNGATISAPALTAEQLAAKSQEEEHERRKHLLDAQIADEREDARQAHLAELDDMAELDDRVRRLKARREEVQRRSVANLRGAFAASASPDADVVMAKGGAAEGKENSNTGTIPEEEEEEDDDDDDDDEDGWDAFRFR